MAEPAEIRAERVAAVFAQTPLAAVVTVLNASVTAAIMGSRSRPDDTALWLLAVVLVSGLRWVVWRAYRRDPAARLRSLRWGAVSAASAGTAGLLWGAGATWLWPTTEAGQLFWVFVLCGMCAGAAALHAAHPATALAFILPAGLPVVWLFAAAGSEHGLAAAAMSAVFLLALAVTARRSASLFGAYVAARLDLARQAAELDAANASLREAIAHHQATEAHLRHAQKMEAVGQLTGGIAHDFNNLLTAVLGSLSLLRKRLPPGDDRAARLLDNARQGAERGAALTQRLLAFGRRQALMPAVLDLPVLIGGMSDLLRGSLGAGVTLESRFPPDLPPVHADANQLELAVLNLVLNAKDAMPGGGQIIIGAESRVVGPGEEAGLAPGAYVVLSIADTGQGMDEATLARAMEPFFTTKGIGKGTGLGLSMVHGMAAQSGGRLTLRSHRGEGTVATLWLPQADPARRGAAGQETEAEAAGVPTRCGTVLLVDDDPLVLASASAMLEDLGHRVLQAASGEAAMELLHRGAAVDMMITDYGMPGMNGQQLAERVRRLHPALPVVIATGYGELPGLAAAGLGRLSKPFGTEALARAVAEHLLPVPEGAGGDG